MGEASESSGHEEGNQEQEGLEGRLNDDEDSHSSEKAEYAARDSGRNYDKDDGNHSRESKKQTSKSTKNSDTIDSKLTLARAYSLKVERSNHGSVALICYENPATEDVEFLF